MKYINNVTVVGLVCLVVSALLFCGTSYAGYCIDKETGKLVRCTVNDEDTKRVSKRNKTVEHQGNPANLRSIPLPQNTTSPKK